MGTGETAGRRVEKWRIEKKKEEEEQKKKKERKKKEKRKKEEIYNGDSWLEHGLKQQPREYVCSR